MKPVRPFVALFLALAALLFGTPVAAMVCAGASAGCDCPARLGANLSDAAPAPVFSVEMTCCRRAERAATAPVAAVVVAPQSAPETPVVAVAVVEDAPAPCGPAASIGADATRMQGIRRHAIGVFTLHSVYLI